MKVIEKFLLLNSIFFYFIIRNYSKYSIQDFNYFLFNSKLIYEPILPILWVKISHLILSKVCADVINDVITCCNWCRVHWIISIQHSDCLQSMLKAFYTKPKYKHTQKNDRKGMGAFKKQADDVNYNGLILPKTSEIVWN